MEKTISQEPTISPQELLRQLEFKRSNASSPEDWTSTDREELLLLEKATTPQSIGTSEAHQAAINRQTMAGIGNNPPLTQEERILIQEANYISLTQENRF